MDFIVLISVLVVLVVFIGGMVCGSYLYYLGHRHGVKLADRLRHDQVPFEDSEPDLVQTFTDGSYEEVS